MVNRRQEHWLRRPGTVDDAAAEPAAAARRVTPSAACSSAARLSWSFGSLGGPVGFCRRPVGARGRAARVFPSGAETPVFCGTTTAALPCPRAFGLLAPPPPLSRPFLKDSLFILSINDSVDSSTDDRRPWWVSCPSGPVDPPPRPHPPAPAQPPPCTPARPPAPGVPSAPDALYAPRPPPALTAAAVGAAPDPAGPGGPHAPRGACLGSTDGAEPPPRAPAKCRRWKPGSPPSSPIPRPPCPTCPTCPFSNFIRSTQHRRDRGVSPEGRSPPLQGPGGAFSAWQGPRSGGPSPCLSWKSGASPAVLPPRPAAGSAGRSGASSRGRGPAVRGCTLGALRPSSSGARLSGGKCF